MTRKKRTRNARRPVAPRIRRTDDALRAASRHVLYEVVQLDQSAVMLATGRWPEPLRNALLESFCVHVRNVMEFHGPRRDPFAEDIIAEDFFDDAAAWTSVRPAWSPELRQVRARVNAEMAHLSYRRLQVTEQAKNWPFITIIEAMDPVIYSFKNHAPGDRLHSDWNVVFAKPDQAVLERQWVSDLAAMLVSINLRASSSHE